MTEEAGRKHPRQFQKIQEHKCQWDAGNDVLAVVSHATARGRQKTRKDAAFWVFCH